MSSGVAVSQECIDKFQELKTGKKIKFLIFKLNKEMTEIGVEKESASQDYADFTAELQDTECRFAVYDFQWTIEGEGIRNKLLFFIWSPDTAKIKDKMLYASSKDALRRALVGIAADIQGTDEAEISYETVLEKCQRR